MTCLRAGEILAFLLIAPRLVAQEVAPVHPLRNLQLRLAIEGQLAPHHTDEYAVKVKAGQFVQLVARQNGADVALNIQDPSGNTVLDADRPNGSIRTRSRILYRRSASADYRIRVSSHSETTGRYQIELLDLRKPKAADRSRIAAETSEFEATRASMLDREARLRSVELYEDAEVRWRRLDPYEDGLCLFAIGGIYDSLGETQNALGYFQRALPGYRTRPETGPAKPPH